MGNCLHVVSVCVSFENIDGIGERENNENCAMLHWDHTQACPTVYCRFSFSSLHVFTVITILCVFPVDCSQTPVRWLTHLWCAVLSIECDVEFWLVGRSVIDSHRDEWKHDIIHKLEIHNMLHYRHKVWWNLDKWFWDMPADQTNRHTRSSHYFTPLPGIN